jgi:hypothetical protein
MSAVEVVRPISEMSLNANLYSNRGKLAVEITELGDDRGTVVAPEQPTCGSFAFLVRTGVKLPTRIVWGEGNRLGLHFENRFVGDWREEAFRREYRASDLIA